MFEDAVMGRPARRPLSFPLQVPGRLLTFWGLAAVMVPAIWVTSGALGFEGRVALVTFALAALAWCLTSIGSTYIALIAALVPTILGFDEPESFFRIVGNALFWLLLGAFIVAAAFTRSGLAQRLAQAIMRGRTTTRGLFLRLTGVILLSALVVPATSSRAALFLPIYHSLGKSLREPRILRALALLIPVAILLSAAASLIGAGAHLLMVELVVGLGGERIGYFQWLVWGLPFAAASCLLSAWVISRLFLSKAERQQPLAFEGAEAGAARQPLSRSERLVLWVVGALVLLWISEPLHGLHATLVAVCGALIVTAPRIGAISLKEGMKAVNWNLLVFMAATIKLGQTLVETGAAAWLIESAFGLVAKGPAALVAMVIVVSTLAHLVVTSRTARSSILVPVVAMLAASAGLDPLALAFVSTIAAGYCLTLPVSAKPLAMFAELEGTTFAPGDLLRLSAWLIPLHLLLLALFAAVVWPWLGLDLQTLSAGNLPPPGAASAQI